MSRFSLQPYEIGYILGFWIAGVLEHAIPANSWSSLFAWLGFVTLTFVALSWALRRD